MKIFLVTFTTKQGMRIKCEIWAISRLAAELAVKADYPGCSIAEICEFGS